jgi:hypothetical protein
LLKLWELKGTPLYIALFLIGFAEDFCYMLWLSMATRGYILPVIVFVYFWQSLHDIYYTLDASTWRDANTRRAEKLGSALGAGCSLLLFPFSH